MEIEFREHNNFESDGSRNFTKWFRFKGLKDLSISRSSRSSGNSKLDETYSNLTPLSEDSEIYLTEYYERLENNGKLHSPKTKKNYRT